MPLGHTLANNQFRTEEIRKERRAATDVSSPRDNALSLGLGMGGAIAGGTAGAIHKERANMARAAQNLPVADSVWSNRTMLGTGLGLLGGVGISRLLEEDNPERDAHRDRIKELRGMDHDELQKERVRSLRKQASDEEFEDINLGKYRRQEKRDARNAAWSSQSDKEGNRMLAGMGVGAGLGLITAGHAANFAAKLQNRKTYPLPEALRRDKLNAFTGTMNGATLGGLAADHFFRDPENAERIGYEQRLKALGRMSDEELRADYMNKQASELELYRNQELRQAKQNIKDSTTKTERAINEVGGVAGLAAGTLAGAKLDRRDFVGTPYRSTRAGALLSGRATIGGLLGGVAGRLAAHAAHPENETKDKYKQRKHDLKHMNDDELRADQQAQMSKQANEFDVDTRALKQYQKDEFTKAMNAGQKSVTKEERVKRTAGNLAGTALGMFAGGKHRHAKDLKRHGMWNSKWKNLSSKEAVIGGIGGSIAGDAVGGQFAEENKEKDAHIKRMQEVARMTPQELLADQKKHMHKAASAFYALQNKEA